MRRAIAFLTTARRHRLGVFLPQDSSKLLRWLLATKETTDSAPRGERLRSALESLGPVPIKFGQLLSTRRDLLSDEIADELALLQDNVAPFSSETAVNIIETQLKQSIATAFRDFDSTPLAAASVAQIHGVTLNDGEAAVIKVLRPGIEKQIAADIRLFKRLAWVVDRFSENFDDFDYQKSSKTMRSRYWPNWTYDARLPMRRC